MLIDHIGLAVGDYQRLDPDGHNIEAVCHRPE